MNSFRTEIKFEELNLQANHETKFIFFGSCFAENIRMALERHHLQASALTHGITYHPIPIAQALLDVLHGRTYTEKDLFFHEERYKSWLHHGAFSGGDISAVLNAMNAKLQMANQSLKENAIIVVTFGTAMGYVHRETNQVVANCHRLPQQTFKKEYSDLDQLVALWKEVIQHYREMFPKVRWIFTVSPVRHLKEGFIENQRSKARLLLLCEEICKEKDCHYFPSYEIIMDDLRDYRFYNDDGIHPSSLAVTYIRDLFYRNVFSQATLEKLTKIEPLVKRIEHRSLHERQEEAEKRKAESLDMIRLIWESET